MLEAARKVFVVPAHISAGPVMTQSAEERSGKLAASDAKQIRRTRCPQDTASENKPDNVISEFLFCHASRSNSLALTASDFRNSHMFGNHLPTRTWEIVIIKINLSSNFRSLILISSPYYSLRRFEKAPF